MAGRTDPAVYRRRRAAVGALFFACVAMIAAVAGSTSGGDGTRQKAIDLRAPTPEEILARERRSERRDARERRRDEREARRRRREREQAEARDPATETSPGEPTTAAEEPAAPAPDAQEAPPAAAPAPAPPEPEPEPAFDPRSYGAY